MRFHLVLLACLLSSNSLVGQDARVAPNAPPDRPLGADSAQWARMNQAIAPYVAQARASYPEAKRRYLAGLPAGQHFFVTTRLRDSTGRVEQVFIAVDSLRSTHIHGKIWSEIKWVQGYRLYQPFEMEERDLLDWLIARPDGTEEGNFVGNFLDTYRP